MRTKDLIKSINKLKRDLKTFSKETSKDDWFITVHCICLDTIKELNTVTKELPRALAEARKEYRKKKK